MDEARLTALEYRVSKLEIALEEKKRKGMGSARHRVFQCPNDVSNEVFNKLIEVRKRLIKETNNISLNLIFSGIKLAEMIRKNCKTLDDLRTIKGLGGSNIDNFGSRFLEVLNSREPEPVQVTVATPAIMTSQQIKELKKSKSKGKSIQIYHRRPISCQWLFSSISIEDRKIVFGACLCLFV